MFTLAPRVMINLADLASTGLVLPGTRASYQLLISGPATALEAFRAALDVPPGVSVTDPSEARPEMRAAFAQAGRFLALAAFAACCSQPSASRWRRVPMPSITSRPSPSCAHSA